VKCPQCSFNHRRNLGMKCSGCGYEFVLDPKRDTIADGRFLAMVRRASCDGTCYFTFNQLVTTFYDSARYRVLFLTFCSTLVLAGGAIGFVWTAEPVIGRAPEWAVTACVLLLLGSLGWWFGVTGYGRPNRKRIDRWRRRFEKSKEPFHQLLKDDFPLENPPPEWSESDIYDYGVEGILFVEHEILVDLLVLNGFHADSRVLVVSESGYPKYIAKHVERILVDQPDVPLFSLHDSCPRRIEYLSSMLEGARFDLAGKSIVDLGFSNSGVRRTRALRRLRRGYLLSVDSVRWGKLAPALSLAIAEKRSMVDVIAACKDPDAATAISFG
jgi:hypothetical protein